MELSNEFFVNTTGLVRIVMDNHTGEEDILPVYGVHRLGLIWIWNPTRGPARSADDAWLRTEDGQQFLEDMGKEDLHFDLNELDGPPDDEENDPSEDWKKLL